MQAHFVYRVRPVSLTSVPSGQNYLPKRKGRDGCVHTRRNQPLRFDTPVKSAELININSAALVHNYQAHYYYCSRVPADLSALGWRCVRVRCGAINALLFLRGWRQL